MYISRKMQIVKVIIIIINIIQFSPQFSYSVFSSNTLITFPQTLLHYFLSLGPKLQFHTLTLRNKRN